MAETIVVTTVTALTDNHKTYSFDGLTAGKIVKITVDNVDQITYTVPTGKVSNILAELLICDENNV